MKFLTWLALTIIVFVLLWVTVFAIAEIAKMTAAGLEGLLDGARNWD